MVFKDLTFFTQTSLLLFLYHCSIVFECKVLIFFFFYYGLLMMSNLKLPKWSLVYVQSKCIELFSKTMYFIPQSLKKNNIPSLSWSTIFKKHTFLLVL